MLIDELKLYMKAGRGGDGVVRWRHEKGKELSGPGGGNGGRGANIYIEAVRDVSILSNYKHLKGVFGENGQSGMSEGKHGKNGKDVTIKLPIGTILTNLKTKQVCSLNENGQVILILNGGYGGFGNEHFKSPVNTTPKESTPGKNGEDAEFLIELELIADIGLIGLPNAGKTSLVNALTNTKYKVGSYPFTTLEPNLCTIYGYVLADIPGLIEESGKGKGLGIKFLKHIKRTKILLHCISLEEENLIDSYKTIRKELSDYSNSLIQKPEYIMLTKSDSISQSDLYLKLKDFQKSFPDKTIFSGSILDDESIEILKKELIKILEKL